MRITKKHLDSFNHAKQFFLKNPKALETVETIIKAKGIKTTLVEGADIVQKEITEHIDSREMVHDTKAKLRLHSKNLRSSAHWLEDAMNSTLEGEEIADEIEWTYDYKNSVASFESLIREIEKYPKLLEGNSTLRKRFEAFQKEFVQYKEALADIGEALKNEIREAEEREEASVQYFPIVSALIYFVYHYLRLSNPVLFNEWKRVQRVNHRKSDRTDDVGREE